jgi:hypothetical protein
MAEFILNIEEGFHNVARLLFYEQKIIDNGWQDCAIIFDELKIAQPVQHENLSGTYYADGDVVFPSVSPSDQPGNFSSPQIYISIHSSVFVFCS